MRTSAARSSAVSPAVSARGRGQGRRSGRGLHRILHRSSAKRANPSGELESFDSRSGGRIGGLPGLSESRSSAFGDADDLWGKCGRAPSSASHGKTLVRLPGQVPFAAGRSVVDQGGRL